MYTFVDLGFKSIIVDGDVGHLGIVYLESFLVAFLAFYWVFVSLDVVVLHAHVLPIVRYNKPVGVEV